MSLWFATSTRLLKDPKVVSVGEHYGGDTVSVVIALLSEAMLQGKGGTVECHFRTLAHDAFTEREKAQEIVDAFIENGFLKLERRDEASIEVTFPAWGRHQAAFRKAKSRASKPASGANVTPSHEQVTPRHKKSPTEHDKTTHEKTEQKEKKSTAVSVRDEFGIWLGHFHDVTGRTSVTGSDGARKAFAARLREGKTLEDLKLATVGCQSDGWRVEKGHNVPETILRASNVEGYISQAVDQPRPTAPSDPASRRAEELRRRGQGQVIDSTAKEVTA